MLTYDHNYEPGAYGVCRRCGGEKHGPAGSPIPDPALLELSVVKLRRGIERDGNLFPAGTQGTIVHVYPGEPGAPVMARLYEVEFAEPVACVLSLLGSDLQLV